MKKIITSYFFILSLFSIISCKSVQQPQTVTGLLDYSDEDVKRTEIAVINDLMLTSPVKALWRASMLGNKSILDECASVLQKSLEDGPASKDSILAENYSESLRLFGYEVPIVTENKGYENIPGLQKENPYAPETIEDCMNTTVTIWVDRGWTVSNGAMGLDVVIGSGFFIDRRGYLITNHHVIESMVDSKYEGYSRLYIKQLSDPDTKIPAKVIGYDPVLDLALLKVEITPEHVFSLGSSKDLHIGDKISAIGTPVGLEGTLTSGIISSTERKLMTMGNVFQIDAAINSGNSGGPIIDEKKNVQAIVFAGMLQFQGLNFAIPVEYLKQELPLLYNGGNGGEVIHPWMGAYGHTKRRGNSKIGLEVQYVMPGGSAFMTGLKEGDVITKIDGKEIVSLDDLQYLLMAYQNERIVDCEYLDTEENLRNCKVYLDMRPKSPLPHIYNSDFISSSFIPIFGLKMIRSSTSNKNTYTVLNVVKGSVADQLCFSETDVVTVKDIKFDNDNEIFYAQLYCQRKQKGFLDATIVLSSTYDSPYYF